MDPIFFCEDQTDSNRGHILLQSHEYFIDVSGPYFFNAMVAQLDRVSVS